MRTLTSGIASAFTANGAYWGVLVQITLPTQTLRFTSLDVGFSYGGFTWLPNDMQVQTVEWDGGVSRPSSLIIGDPDLIYWTLALTLAFADSLVDVFGIYEAAPDEAVPLWSGRIAGAVRGDMAVTLALNNDSNVLEAPRDLVQYIVNPIFLLPAGTVLNIAGQRWIIDRPA